MRSFIIAGLIVLAACSVSWQEQPLVNAAGKAVPRYPLKAFAGKVVYGDFDGNHVMDTVSEQLFSMDTRLPVDSFPDPEHVMWDSLVDYGFRNQLYSILITTGAAADTTYLSNSLGLYVLLNVGDINEDGADDLGLVTDSFDFSALNSCVLYSLCGGRWRQVGQFAINENAFNWVKGQKVEFKDIPGFLEKRDGKWFFRDAMQIDTAETEEAMNRMALLKGRVCR